MHQSLASGVQIGVTLHWMVQSCLDLDITWHAHLLVKKARDSQWVKWFSTSHTRRSKNINQVLAIIAPTSRQSSTKILPGKSALRCAKTSSLRSAEAFRLRQVSMIQTIPRSRTKQLDGVSERRSVQALSRKAMIRFQVQAHTPLPLWFQTDPKFPCTPKQSILNNICEKLDQVRETMKYKTCKILTNLRVLNSQ